MDHKDGPNFSPSHIYNISTVTLQHLPFPTLDSGLAERIFKLAVWPAWDFSHAFSPENKDYGSLTSVCPQITPALGCMLSALLYHSDESDAIKIPFSGLPPRGPSSSLWDGSDNFQQAPSEEKNMILVLPSAI